MEGEVVGGDVGTLVGLAVDGAGVAMESIWKQCVIIRVVNGTQKKKWERLYDIKT